MVMWYQNPWSRQQCAAKLPVGSTLTLNRDHPKKKSNPMNVGSGSLICLSFSFPFLSFSFLFLSFPMWNGDAIPGCAQSGCRMQYKVACSTTTYSTKASLVDFFFCHCLVYCTAPSWLKLASCCSTVLGLVSPCNMQSMPPPPTANAAVVFLNPLACAHF